MVGSIDFRGGRNGLKDRERNRRAAFYTRARAVNASKGPRNRDSYEQVLEKQTKRIEELKVIDPQDVIARLKARKR